MNKEINKIREDIERLGRIESQPEGYDEVRRLAPDNAQDMSFDDLIKDIMDRNLILFQRLSVL